MLWQLPPGFRRDDERLAEALEQLPPGRHCFEFRDDSWFVEPVYELLREHGAALVIGDTPQRPYTAARADRRLDVPALPPRQARPRNGNYSERELEEWARGSRGWAAEHEVFAYFNNDWNGYAVATASGCAAGWASRATLRPWNRSASRS